MPDLDLISVIVQSGAIGILLAFGWFGYKLAGRLITVGAGIVGNHLAHLEAVLEKVEHTLNRLNKTLDKGK